MRPQIREEFLIQEGLDEIHEEIVAEAAATFQWDLEAELERQNYSAYLDSLHGDDDEYCNSPYIGSCDDYDDGYDDYDPYEQEYLSFAIY